jgi:hypothetical protein
LPIYLTVRGRGSLKYFFIGLGFRELIVLLYPTGSISAEFLGVGFIEGSKEFEDGIS